MVKRLFDVLASFIAIILVSPVLLLAFLSVRIASPGPAIYRAQRIGRGGTPFVMHKFRTMHVRHATGSVITSAKDSRIFLAGKILRALKIDELPQLFDVLAGRMSIVGPRPEDPKIVELYYTPLARETLSVAPGLSSPGSVHYYTSSDFEAWVLHDEKTSVVTVGSFSSDRDPRIAPLAKLFGGRAGNAENPMTGNDGVIPATFTLPQNPTRQNPLTKQWFFDKKTVLIKVPVVR